MSDCLRVSWFNTNQTPFVKFDLVPNPVDRAHRLWVRCVAKTASGWKYAL